MPVTHGDIGGAEPSTVTFKVDTVTLSLNSTTVHREILVVGSPQSSNALAAVVATEPASTEFGAVVRQAGPSSVTQGTSPWIIGGNSTIVFLPAYLSTAVSPPSNSTALNVRVVGGVSSAVDFPVRAVLPSTAADNPVLISGNSTAIQGTNPWLCAITGPISSAAPAAGDSGVIVRVVGYSTIVSVANTVTVTGAVTTSTIVTIAAMPANSSQVEVRALPANSSQVEVRGTVLVSVTTPLSSAAPSSGSSGIHVRQVWDNRLTAASTNAFASTTFAINSSAAGIRAYVTAYSITSTVAAGTTLRFMQGSSLLWPIVLQAVSSAIAGANLAVYPYLFRNPTAARPLSIDVDSSLAGFKVGVSYYLAP